MKANIRLHKTRLLTACLLLFSFFFLHQSCTKINTDVPGKFALTDAEVTQKFFNVPANAPFAVKRIAESMKVKNIQSEFVKAFVTNNGYPAWNKVTVAVHSSPVANVFLTGGSNSTGADTIVTIPIVPADVAYVSGFVSAKLNGSVSLDLYRGSDYAIYSFNNVPADSLNADKAALQLMVLNNMVFGSATFRITDNRLFSSSSTYNPSLPYRIATLKDSVPGGGSGYLEMCGYICVDWVCPICYGQDPDCPIGGHGTACGWIETGCAPPPTGGGGGGTGTGGGGGGSFPCAGSQAKSQAPADPCGGSATPPVTPTPLPPVDPCIAAKSKAKQMDSLYSKSKSDSVINTMPGLSTATTETGFALYKQFSVNPNTHDTTLGKYYYGSAIQGGATGVYILFVDPFPPFTLPAGTHHTHPRDGYHAQSAADVYDDIGFQLLWSWFEGAMATGANGETFAVSITDYNQAAAFYNTRSQYLDGDHWKEDSEIGKAFSDVKKYFKQFYKGNPSKDNLAYEMAMASVLNEYNSGLTLFRRNAAGNFKPIIVKITVPNPSKPKKKIYIIVNCDND
jgi:hypothetical protein